MFDAHCHTDLTVGSAESALAEARAAGVVDLMVAGVDPAGWDRQRALRGPGVHLGFGLHPWAVRDRDEAGVDEALIALAAALRAGPAVALGETGLDFGPRCPEESWPRQRRAFRAQLELARVQDFPVILHVVAAHAEVLEILRADGMPGAGAMVHAWSGPPDMVADYAQSGIFLSFCATVLSRGRVKESARRVPAALLLAETDAPDQPPRGVESWTPAGLKVVIEALAKVRGAGPEEIAAATASNAARLFRLPDRPAALG